MSPDQVPDLRGYYGAYGGRFIPETLALPLEQLDGAFRSALSDPAFLDERIRFQSDLLADRALGRFGWHVDTLAGYVELPAVIRATQAALLVTTEPQRYPAMSTVTIHQAETILGVTESNQFF